MFVKNMRAARQPPLMFGLLASLGFNFLMHLFYGTELFLYTPYWMYALVFFIALALADIAERRWFQYSMILVLLAFMANNFWFIFNILHGLAPFYAAVP
jgi:hypothetical protein